MRCIIVGASPQKDLSRIRQVVSDDDFIICADGGYETALLAGMVPHLYIGDGDSGQIPNHTDRILLPQEKDATDVQAAIDTGLLRGYKEFWLLGCTGHRFDHHFANICMLERLNHHNARGVIVDDNNFIMLHTGGKITLEQIYTCKYISLAPLDENVTGVTITGVKYPLENATLMRAQPLGISNEFMSEEATLSSKSGKLLVIYSND